MTETVIGGTGGPQLTGDYLATRAAVRALVVTNMNTDPQAVIAGLPGFGWTLQDICGAVDDVVDLPSWLRINGAPDGYLGLRVFTHDQTDAFFTWRDAVTGWITAINPRSLKAAWETMETEERRHANNPAYVIQYLSPTWQAELAAKKQAAADAIAYNTAHPGPNVIG